MANRFINPNPQYLDATPNVYNGGNLYFYVTGTSTPTNTYSDSALTIPNANPVPLDSAGRPSTEIFLDPAVTYKVVLEDSLANVIWTRDPVVDPAANATSTFTVYPGNPNGNVAGYQGNPGGTGASVIWDTVNNILYVCTTSGTAATAVWTAVAATLSGAVVINGVITPTSLAADQNDYQPTGFSGAARIRQNSSVAVSITGLDLSQVNGRFLTYTNISAFNHTLVDESALSVAANRFALDADLIIPPGQTYEFWWDSASARWRLVGDFRNAPSGDPGGRLTLTTAIPVLQADVTAATTVFYTPYKHNYARLYNGTHWTVVQFSELSQTLADTTKSPAAAAVSSVYDMFLWNDSGTLRCTRGPAWTSGTARGAGAGTTEIERIDGTWVNANAITNGPGENLGLYVGTIGTSASGANGQLNMMFFPAAAAGGSVNRLDVWNMYNRVPVASTNRDSANTWTYSLKTWQAKNANTGNRTVVVCGINEDAITAVNSALASNNAGGTTRIAYIGVGIDVATAFSGLPGVAVSAAASTPVQIIGNYSGLVGLGSHYFQAIEAAEAVGTTTFYGDNNDPTFFQTGLQLTWVM